MIHNYMEQDSWFDRSMKHILLIQDLGSNFLKILNQSTYSISKTEDRNLVIYEGIDREAEIILLRVPLNHNNDYRFRVIPNHLHSKQKQLIVNGEYCYYRNIAHGDWIQLGNVASVQYYTIPDTLDIVALQELLQLSSGENWYETCLNIFKSFASSLQQKSEETVENQLNYLALLTDLSKELIIEFELDNQLLYVNSTAIQEFADLLHYGKYHSLLIDIENQIQKSQIYENTQYIEVNNNIYLRDFQFNESTGIIIVFARRLQPKQTELNENQKNVAAFVPENQKIYNYITNLPDRASAEKYLKQKLINQNNTVTAVFLVDLDNFKYINDTFGYFEGDRVIKIISERLRNVLHQEQFIAHWEGNQFIIISDQSICNNIYDFAEQILNIVQQKIAIQQNEICLTAKMGISFSLPESEQIEPLIESSYFALRQAKIKRNPPYYFYDNSINMSSGFHNNLNRDLKDAIAKDQLLVHYQPIINPQTGKILSLEACLRWQHPKLGLIKPVDFIPIAEQTGLIFSLGEWMLRTVCIQNNYWQNIGIPKIPVSVNFSPKQLQEPNFIEKIEQIFQDTDFFDYNYLSFEIEESKMIQENTVPVAFKQLSELGIQLVIDNFGNNDSSFTNIQNVPANSIKTDPVLIENIVDDESSLNILEVILAFSKSLKLNSIVQGVETKEQLGILRKIQCQALQGTFVYDAMPISQMTLLLQKHFDC